MIFQGAENTLFEIFQPPLNNHCCSLHHYIINGQTNKYHLWLFFDHPLMVNDNQKASKNQQNVGREWNLHLKLPTVFSHKVLERIVFDIAKQTKPQRNLEVQDEKRDRRRNRWIQPRQLNRCQLIASDLSQLLPSFVPFQIYTSSCA